MVLNIRTLSIVIAVCLMAWAVIHFVSGEFIVGRAPASGSTAWAYASAIILLAASASMVVIDQQKFKVAITVAGIMVLGWAASRNLYIVVSKLDYGGTLTNFGKGITIGSGLILIANGNKRTFLFASICTGIFFLIGGIQHFIFIDFVKTLVPRWIPGDVFWSYLAGVGLIASGIALITGLLRTYAALIASLMVFTWFVILHVPRGFGETANINEWIAIFEALFVAALLGIIYLYGLNKS